VLLRSAKCLRAITARGLLHDVADAGCVEVGRVGSVPNLDQLKE
jgi:hypothetical protein